MCDGLLILGNASTFGGMAFEAVTVKAWHENVLYIEWGIVGRNKSNDGFSCPPACTLCARFRCCCLLRRSRPGPDSLVCFVNEPF